MPNRIYNEKVNINTNDVKNFYDLRAVNCKNGFNAVLLTDDDPEENENLNNYDKNIILPKLGIKNNFRCLEIGCGLGRIAHIVAPLCKYYHGIDFSIEMIKIAKEYCKEFNKKCSFEQYSASDGIKHLIQEESEKFDCIIFTGVCMYINDEELSEIFENLSQLTNEHACIYIRESAAIKERLTLVRFDSSALKSKYDAIYRTPNEYHQILQPLLHSGFKIEEEGFLPEQVKCKRNETNNYFMIIRK